jgi:hypothetical protein
MMTRHAHMPSRVCICGSVGEVSSAAARVYGSSSLTLNPAAVNSHSNVWIQIVGISGRSRYVSVRADASCHLVLLINSKLRCKSRIRTKECAYASSYQVERRRKGHL